MISCLVLSCDVMCSDAITYMLLHKISSSKMSRHVMSYQRMSCHEISSNKN